jgi:multiple sugar transport system permease protein
MYPQPLHRWPASVQWAYRIAVPLALLVWLLPLIAVVATSFRSADEIMAGNYWGTFRDFSPVANYVEVFQSSPMWQYVLNSILITVPAVFFALALASMAGFALATYAFKGNTVLFALFIAGNFIPFQILMIPVRDLTLQTGLFDTRTGLVLFHLAFHTGFCTLFLRNFIKQLPHELIEAARMEGASEWTVYWRVVLPLIRPALAALAVLVFTFVWNDYFWALTLTQGDDARPITVGVAQLKGTWVAKWNLVSAGAIVAALPAVLLFFAMQRHFIAGLTFGATKG